MAEIVETRLPGVGVRQDFVTSSGRRVGVVTHRSGHRDLVIYDESDPDRCLQSLRLEEPESWALAELLGAAHLTQGLREDQEQAVEGLTIDWVLVRQQSACAGEEIGALDIRQQTGSSIVAIVRQETTIPAPGADERLLEGDTAVVVGTPEGVRKTAALLTG